MSTAQAAEPANKVTTKAVAEPLKKAQEAMKNKQWDAALAGIKQAQASEKKTPFEAYQIDEFLGYVLIQQKKFGEAAPVFERMINSGLPAARAGRRAHQDRRAAVLPGEGLQEVRRVGQEVARQAPWQRRDGRAARPVVLRDERLQERRGTMGSVVNNAEKGGRNPQENWLQIVLSSHFKLDNKDGIADALKKLVRYYPKPEYWENLLDIYRRKDTSDRVSLGYYRLMNDIGTLKQADDYVEMAQLALDAGVPGRSRSHRREGRAGRHAEERQQDDPGPLQPSARQRQESRGRRQTAARAAGQGSGEGELRARPSSASARRTSATACSTRRSSALKKGITKGGVTDMDEAQISLGIAYLRKGQKDQARQAFKAVKGESKWHDLAELWDVRSQAGLIGAPLTAQ